MLLGIPIRHALSSLCRKFRFSKSKINPFRSQRVHRSKIKPGDHLYYYVHKIAYTHHGLYCGKGMVLHYNADQKHKSLWMLFVEKLFCFINGEPKPKPKCKVPFCGFRRRRNAALYSCLDCFSESAPLYLYEYGVGTFSFLSKLRGGACTIAESDSLEKVFHRANQLLRDSIGYGPYHLFGGNCEDFVLYCKTGLVVFSNNHHMGTSGQVNMCLVAPLAVFVSLPYILLIPNRVVALVVVAIIYSFSRLAFDIGVRDDAHKVKVEKLISFHGGEMDTKKKKKKKKKMQKKSLMGTK